MPSVVNREWSFWRALLSMWLSHLCQGEFLSPTWALGGGRLAGMANLAAVSRKSLHLCSGGSLAWEGRIWGASRWKAGRSARCCLLSKMGLKPAWEVNSPEEFNAFPVSDFQPCYMRFDPSAPRRKAPAQQEGEAVCRLAFVGTSCRVNGSALGH